MNLKDNIFLNIRGVDYDCFMNKISESEIVNLLQNADLSKKKWIVTKYNFSLSCIKDGKRNYSVW